MKYKKSKNTHKNRKVKALRSPTMRKCLNFPSFSISQTYMTKGNRRPSFFQITTILTQEKVVLQVQIFFFQKSIFD